MLILPGSVSAVNWGRKLTPPLHDHESGVTVGSVLQECPTFWAKIASFISFLRSRMTPASSKTTRPSPSPRLAACSGEGHESSRYVRLLYSSRPWSTCVSTRSRLNGAKLQSFVFPSQIKGLWFGQLRVTGRFLNSAYEVNAQERTNHLNTGTWVKLERLQGRKEKAAKRPAVRAECGEVFLTTTVETQSPASSENTWMPWVMQLACGSHRRSYS